MSAEEKRTERQGRSLHLWFRRVAKTLNDSGLDQRVVIEALQTRGLDVSWTEESVKTCIWKPVAKAMTHKESTTEANRIDYNAEYTALCKWFGQEFGVVLPPWPDRYSRGINE